MRPKTIIVLMTISFLMFNSAVSVTAYEQIGGPVGIDGSGTLPLTPSNVLDNFNRAAENLNVWSDMTTTFSSQYPPTADAKCVASAETDPAIVYGGAGTSLKLDYNVDLTNSYAGYVSMMGGGSIEPYKTLIFRVKGASGGEYFKIEIKNTSTKEYSSTKENTHYYRNTGRVYISDYLNGGVTTGWRKVSIPLKTFANLDDFTSMKELVFVFENAQSDMNESPRQGTIYIDNIVFSTTELDTVRLDYFSDVIGSNAMGGNIGDFGNDGGTASHTFDNTECVTATRSMKIHYSVLTGYSGVALIIGGGNDGLPVLSKPYDKDKMGWIPVDHNLSDYKHLKYYVKAHDAAHNPKIMKVEIVSSTGTKESVHSVTEGWILIDINMETLGVDLSSISQVNFVFEGWRIGGAVGSKVGDVYMDNLEFTKE
ncbi:MAG: carbohydrate binding domain-containing protein [Candidatus Omnitrophota bacterium]